MCNSNPNAFETCADCGRCARQKDLFFYALPRQNQRGYAYVKEWRHFPSCETPVCRLNDDENKYVRQEKLPPKQTRPWYFMDCAPKDGRFIEMFIREQYWTTIKDLPFDSEIDACGCVQRYVRAAWSKRQNGWIVYNPAAGGSMVDALQVSIDPCLNHYRALSYEFEGWRELAPHQSVDERIKMYTSDDPLTPRYLNVS